MELLELCPWDTTARLQVLQAARQFGLVRGIVDAGQVQEKRFYPNTVFGRHAFPRGLDFLHGADAGKTAWWAFFGKRDFLRGDGKSGWVRTWISRWV